MKKIMFNDRYGLTRKVLSGSKTQTRRIIPDIEIDWVRRGRVTLHCHGEVHPQSGLPPLQCPPPWLHPDARLLG